MSMIVLAGGLETLLLVASNQVPTLRVEQSCRAASSIQMAESQSYDACVRDEMSARTELTQSWTTFAATDRERCASEASSDGIHSYVELLVCLQISRGIDSSNHTRLKGARRK
jgi:hypothetical protein